MEQTERKMIIGQLIEAGSDFWRGQPMCGTGCEKIRRTFAQYEQGEMTCCNCYRCFVGEAPGENYVFMHSQCMYPEGYTHVPETKFSWILHDED